MIELILALAPLLQSPPAEANPAAPDQAPQVGPTGSWSSVLTGFDLRAPWLAATACSPTLVNFDALAPGTLITTELASAGIALVGGTSSVFIGSSGTLPFPMYIAGSLPSEPNFMSLDLSPPIYGTGRMRFAFSAPTNALGFYVADQAPLGNFEIEVFDGGGASMGFISVLPRTLPSSFAGVVSTLPFAAAEIRSASNFDSWGIDDLELCSGSVTVYCTAKQNSLGCTPGMGSAGVSSASAPSGFLVAAAQVRNQKPGLLFYSLTGRQSVAFQCGTLCLKTPLWRTPASSSGGNAPPANDCSGLWSLDLNCFAVGACGGSPQPALLAVGQLVQTQFWGRDQGYAPPCNTSLTDALEYSVGP